MFWVYVGLICIMFVALIAESQMDFDKACRNIDNECSLQWCFQNNLKLLIIEVTGAFIFSIVELQRMGVLGVLSLFGVILYHLIEKLKNVGGYAESVFEIVEAFSFMSILVSRWQTALLHTVLLGLWIIIGRFVCKGDKGWVSLITGLIEVWVVLLISMFIKGEIGESAIIQMILFSYSILKGINLFVVYLAERYNLEETG